MRVTDATDRKAFGVLPLLGKNGTVLGTLSAEDTLPIRKENPCQAYHMSLTLSGRPFPVGR